jgi:peptidoglycan/xylan/chitin deacetylase (PgdA/CDA1 family)
MVHAVFAFTIYYLRGWHLLFWLYRLFTGKTAVVVFMYHRIVREQKSEYLQGYEKGLAENDYLAQLREIEKIFEVISLEQFTSMVSGESAPKSWKPVALLTFDDGDSENFTLAFPPLWEKNIPAVSFIATDFVDSHNRFYHLRVTNALNNFDDSGWHSAANLPMPDSMKKVFDSNAPDFAKNKYAIRRGLIAPMDILPPAERNAIIDKWEALTGGKYTLGIDCMSWEQICSLTGKNIAVGSHTVHHNKLELLSLEEMRQELTESKRILESKLGKEVTSICYPQGSHNQDIISEAERAGYSVGFTTVAGLVDYPLNSRQRLAIPRIGVRPGKPYEMVYPFGLALLRHLRRKAS